MSFDRLTTILDNVEIMANIIVPNYERFDADGLELAVDTSTGKAYASISAAARMLEIETIQLKRELEKKGGLDFNVIIATIPAEGGTKLIDSNTVFELALRHNLPLAKKMGSAGANLYMLKLAGYETKVVEALPMDELAWMELAVAKKKESLALEAAVKQKELENKLLEEENQELSEAVDDLFNYSSITRIAKFNNCSEKLFNWRLLKNASANLKVEIKQVPCPKFQTKKLYSHDAWRLAYPGFRLPETTTLVIQHYPKIN